MAAVVVAPAVVSASGLSSELSSELSGEETDGSDFKIVSDEVKGKVRYVTATPSANVCSNRIDIEIDIETDTIRDCKFTRGCPGNAIGLCSLVKGMKRTEVIARLQGTPCGKKTTSCPDQLARILASLK